MQRRVLISCTTGTLFDGNIRYVNTRFGLPEIVLIIMVGEIVHERLTVFMVDGSMSDTCVHVWGITGNLCQ